MSQHTPLHLIAPATNVLTGGRLTLVEGHWWLSTAHAQWPLRLEGQAPTLAPGLLARVLGHFDGTTLWVEHLEPVHTPPAHAASTLAHPPGAMLAGRAGMLQEIRTFFAERQFLEVTPPCWVPSPGTDVYLDPFAARFQAEASVAEADAKALEGYLHTSPEFAMKRLLSEGAERIFALCPVWRNGEVTARHNPEFTMLEWYRAWEPLDAIIADTEELVAHVLATCSVADSPWGALKPPFVRRTMQDVFHEATGIDLLACMNARELREAALSKNLLGLSARQPARDGDSWEETFFELMVAHVDPLIARLGAVCITHWPAPLAVLARRTPGDPRTAERFELYVDGLELTNGFGELTDPTEQRERFEADLARRRELGLAEIPLPEQFLQALEWGMPPSAGVALGVDRLLMLAMGASRIEEVQAFAMRRDGEGGVAWG